MIEKARTAATWTLADAQRLFRIQKWGAGYYTVNEAGNVCVCPQGNRKRQIDLKKLVDELRERGIQPPVLIRFMDILSDRIKKITRCFAKARKEFNYDGSYHPVYPIKVNQQRQVVEAMIQAGKSSKLGLEVGSKPEMLTVLAVSPDYPCLVICNGYKDAEFIRMALSGQQLGYNVIIVAEKLSEVERVIKIARETGLRPSIGVRVKLATEGTGRWASSAGDRSKFGLRINELMRACDMLRENDMIDSLQLLHFHIGSQISQIDRVKVAMTEVARIYAELAKIGVQIDYVDVGGGLGVDYDGTSSSNPHSINYTMQEYANDIIFSLQQICENEKLPAPTVITESGRALTAHYSVLVTNLVDFSAPSTTLAIRAEKGAPEPLPELQYIYDELDVRNCREFYHDAVYLRRQAQARFNVGNFSLEARAHMEELFWTIMGRICSLAKQHNLDYQEFEGLDTLLASTFFANFSLFQSLPDSWAIDQLFPILPIQRLNEPPTLQCVLADITCDSDGKVEQYINEGCIGASMPIHHIEPDEHYYVGFFLVGAYQEILGDLHNMFGDTNAVHVIQDASGGYKLQNYIRGDTVRDVLTYLQYNPNELLERLRAKVERAVEREDITVTDSAQILRLFENGLSSYTYLNH